MLRVPPLSQRLWQLRVGRDDGPNPPRDRANSLRENDPSCDETLRCEFQPEHTRVLAGEQLPQKSARGTKKPLSVSVPFVLFVAKTLTSSGHGCCSRFRRRRPLFKHRTRFNPVILARGSPLPDHTETSGRAIK